MFSRLEKGGIVRKAFSGGQLLLCMFYRPAMDNATVDSKMLNPVLA